MAPVIPMASMYPQAISINGVVVNEAISTMIIPAASKSETIFIGCSPVEVTGPL